MAIFGTQTFGSQTTPLFYHILVHHKQNRGSNTTAALVDLFG